MTYGMNNEGPRGRGRDRSAVAKAFETVLVDEQVPYIDTHFRTIARRESRAMAGLSMGGMESKAITMSRTAVFGYYGLLSGGTYMPADLKLDDKSTPKPKLIFESCGSRENPGGIDESVKALTAARPSCSANICASMRTNAGLIGTRDGSATPTWRRTCMTTTCLKN